MHAQDTSGVLFMPKAKALRNEACSRRWKLRYRIPDGVSNRVSRHADKKRARSIGAPAGPGIFIKPTPFEAFKVTGKYFVTSLPSELHGAWTRAQRCINEGNCSREIARFIGALRNFMRGIFANSKLPASLNIDYRLKKKFNFNPVTRNFPFSFNEPTLSRLLKSL